MATKVYVCEKQLQAYDLVRTLNNHTGYTFIVASGDSSHHYIIFTEHDLDEIEKSWVEGWIQGYRVAFKLEGEPL